MKFDEKLKKSYAGSEPEAVTGCRDDRQVQGLDQSVSVW